MPDTHPDATPPAGVREITEQYSELMIPEQMIHALRDFAGGTPYVEADSIGWRSSDAQISLTVHAREGKYANFSRADGTGSYYFPEKVAAFLEWTPWHIYGIRGVSGSGISSKRHKRSGPVWKNNTDLVARDGWGVRLQRDDAPHVVQHAGNPNPNRICYKCGSREPDVSGRERVRVAVPWSSHRSGTAAMQLCAACAADVPCPACGDTDCPVRSLYFANGEEPFHSRAEAEDAGAV